MIVSLRCELCHKMLWFWQDYDHYFDSKSNKMIWAHDKCIKFRDLMFSR